MLYLLYLCELNRLEWFNNSGFVINSVFVLWHMTAACNIRDVYAKESWGVYTQSACVYTQSACGVFAMQNVCCIWWHVLFAATSYCIGVGWEQKVNQRLMLVFVFYVCCKQTIISNSTSLSCAVLLRKIQSLTILYCRFFKNCLKYHQSLIKFY